MTSHTRRRRYRLLLFSLCIICLLYIASMLLSVTTSDRLRDRNNDEMLYDPGGDYKLEVQDLDNPFQPRIGVDRKPLRVVKQSGTSTTKANDNEEKIDFNASQSGVKRYTFLREYNHVVLKQDDHKEPLYAAGEEDYNEYDLEDNLEETEGHAVDQSGVFWSERVLNAIPKGKFIS